MFTPEEKPTPLKPILAAVVVLILAGTAFYFFNFRKATISVTKTQVYAAHTVTESKSGSNNIVGQLGESSDDLFLIVTLHIKNNFAQPMSISSITGTYTDSTDATMDTPALNHTDLERTEGIFPALTTMLPKPLSLNTDIPSGDTLDANILLHFTGLTEPLWKSRKSGTLTLNFTHQAPITVTLP